MLHHKAILDDIHENLFEIQNFYPKLSTISSTCI